MIRRHTADEATDKSTLSGAKTVIGVLIIATVVIWLAPALLTGETVIGGATAVPCDESDGTANIVEDLACARDGVKGAVLTLVDIFKYVLLVAAIGSVAVLRVAPPRASP